MMRRDGHAILLGGVGGDSHSVGLVILRQALLSRGYRVCYLGTQNRLEDFFRLAPLSNIIMISCMDGHALYYLRNFSEHMRQYRAHPPLWYLGGNLHIGDGSGCEGEFLEMGFDRVFVKFVDLETLTRLIEADLKGVLPLIDCGAFEEKSRRRVKLLAAKVFDERLDLVEFQGIRREVLQQWETGAEAKHLEENAAFLTSQPSFSEAQARVDARRGPILLQPRSGVPLLDEQIRLFQAFKKAGVRVLSYQVDSLTRNNAYTTVAEAIDESRAAAISTVNGFPVIYHGVGGLRKVIRAVGLPLQARHSCRDPRLLAEISYAGGVSSFEGGAICYNVPYYKDYSLDQSIKRWQYVDRLTGLYYERFGIVLDREFFGTLTATLIPPSLAIVCDVIEAILAVRQGVKCVSLGYAEQGNRIQDVAAIRVLGRMAGDVLGHLGYTNIQINTVFHQYMAAFPVSRRRACDLIFNSSISAALSGATRVMVKTPVEASRIPSLEDNLEGIDLAKRGVAAADYEKVDETRVEQECAVIRREVEAILDSVIFCGRGDMVEGVISAFQKGFIDIPFSPSIYCKGDVMTARDREGAVRFLSVGNLQFNRELCQFHEDRMAARRRAMGLNSKKQDYMLVERDVLQIPRSQYEAWPLFK